jgi:hypothetical protein
MEAEWLYLTLCLYYASGHKKSVTATHLEQLEDSDKEAREEFKIISQQEYVMRLRELNEEIALAWLNNERVSALRLTIKVSWWMNNLCQCPLCSPLVEQYYVGLRSFKEVPCFDCNKFGSTDGILYSYQAIGRWRGS